MKTELPASIEKEMVLYRLGERLPMSYIAFHVDMAGKALAALVAEHQLTVHRQWGAEDGWCDGMITTWAIVEEPGGRLVKLSWHDGNQEFFEHGSGSWPYRISKPMRKTTVNV